MVCVGGCGVCGRVWCVWEGVVCVRGCGMCERVWCVWEGVMCLHESAVCTCAGIYLM